MNFTPWIFAKLHFNKIHNTDRGMEVYLVTNYRPIYWKTKVESVKYVLTLLQGTLREKISISTKRFTPQNSTLRLIFYTDYTHFLMSEINPDFKKILRT